MATESLQDNRLNCVGVRFDRFALGLPLRRPRRRDIGKAFSTEKGREDDEATEQNALRFGRSTFNALLRGLDVLAFFLL